jgi:hypothetical protein
MQEESLEQGGLAGIIFSRNNSYWRELNGKILEEPEVLCPKFCVHRMYRTEPTAIPQLWARGAGRRLRNNWLVNGFIGDDLWAK